MMDFETVAFLVGYYWSYMVGAGLVGLVVGWRNMALPKREDAGT